MYKLGLYFGYTINLVFYVALGYDIFNNVSNNRSYAIDLVAIFILFMSRQLLMQATRIYDALEFIAISTIDKKDLNPSVDQIFNDLTKDI